MRKRIAAVLTAMILASVLPMSAAAQAMLDTFVKSVQDTMEE